MDQTKKAPANEFQVWMLRSPVLSFAPRTRRLYLLDVPMELRLDTRPANQYNAPAFHQRIASGGSVNQATLPESLLT